MVPCSCRDDQTVVQDLVVADDDPASCDVDLGHLAQQDAGIALLSQNRPERCCDIGGRQRPGGHLVKKGLKQVKIAQVNQGYANRCVLQAAYGVQPSESTTDSNHLVRTICQSVFGYHGRGRCTDQKKLLGADSACRANVR